MYVPTNSIELVIAHLRPFSHGKPSVPGQPGSAAHRVRRVRLLRVIESEDEDSQGERVSWFCLWGKWSVILRCAAEIHPFSWGPTSFSRDSGLERKPARHRGPQQGSRDRASFHELFIVPLIMRAPRLSVCSCVKLALQTPTPKPARRHGRQPRFLGRKGEGEQPRNSLPGRPVRRTRCSSS